jgi:hypothetical protein
MKKMCKGPCGLEKDIEEFPTNRPGSVERRPACRDCKNIVCNEYYHRTKTIEYAARDLLNWARRTAKNKNFGFNLEKSDINIPKFCPVFGIELNVNKGGWKDNSISIDRIDNSYGYIKNNIIVVSWKANHIKGPALIEEMKLIYENYFDIDLNNLHKTLNINKGIKSFYYTTWHSARSRAKKKNIQFNIEKQDIIVPQFCPILGIKINKGAHSTDPNMPSLDRIDNTLGYIKGNVRIISFKANQLKLNSTFEEYEKLYLFYKNLIENK